VDVVTGSPVADVFSAFEADGYTKRSGLVLADFAISVFRNGVPFVTSVTVVEISVTGDYKLQFTPPSDATYQIQVHILFSHDFYNGTYVSTRGLAPIISQIDKIDLAPTLGPSTVISGSLMDRIMNKDQDKTYNQYTDSLEALRDRIG
jgi:hypothetical protein